MKFASSLKRGTLQRRYKRFLADVELDDGSVVTASCPNTGSMKGLCDPGMRVWLSESDSPTRKYKHTWEMVEADLGNGPVMVGINTGHPNKLVSEAIEARRIKPLAGYASLKREQKYGENSRIDILLEDDAKGRAYVEIKNVHLMRKRGLAEFPDSVTARGAKHLDELGRMAQAGHRAVMLFLIQRQDATRFDLADDIDPNYAEAFERAKKNGVEALAYRCRLDEQEIMIDRAVKMTR